MPSIGAPFLPNQAKSTGSVVEWIVEEGDALEKRIAAALVCVHEGKLLAVEIQDPQTAERFFVVPGGAIEEGEDPAESAVRETLEETGYLTVTVDMPPVTIRYSFLWDGTHYDRVTTLMAGRLAPSEIDTKGRRREPAPVDDAPYLLRSLWIERDQIAGAFAFEPKLRDAIEALVGKLMSHAE